MSGFRGHIPAACSGGAALPLCLALAGLLALLGIQALRTATTEAKLANSIVARQQLFTAAEEALRAGLAWATANPAALPAPVTAIDLTAPAPDYPNLQAQISLTALGTDDLCLAFTGVRAHYEIAAAITTTTGIVRRHVRGFYVCTESCAAPACIGAVTAPVPTYWTYAG